MRIKIYQLLILFFLGHSEISGQSLDSSIIRFQATSGISKNNIQYSSKMVAASDSLIILFHRSVCKGYRIQTFFVPRQNNVVKIQNVQSLPKPKFLTIHGSFYYDFIYRSQVDTPLNQKNFQQHTERVNLDVLVKEKYPLKVSFMLRQSNSSYFKNFVDINFQFDQFGHYKKLQQEAINKLTERLENRPDLNALKALLEEKEKLLLKMKTWMESPQTLQKIIEERERQYAKELQPEIMMNNTFDGKVVFGSVDHFKNKGEAFGNSLIKEKEKVDSLTPSLAKLYENQKKEFDSVSNTVKLIHKQIDSTKNEIQKAITSARQKIYKATNERELNKIAGDNGIDLGQQDKFQKRIASIKRFSIGRSMLNYTELTAQNIAITGLNVEYNPSYYAAFAAGKIDYRFRDFFNKSAKSNGQYLVLGRIGLGDPQRKALILTAFEGRKNSSEFALNDTAINHVNIIGYSIEYLFKKDENNGLSLEVAKSTKPITGNLQTNKQISALWKLSDETNLGINIKAQTIIPGTGTKVSGFFRKTGENFQSFSLFSYNTDQTAWLAKVDQYLFKRKANIAGMLRRNDFTNPFSDKTYKTSTVFKSLLLNIRVPKYPSLSLGYYPGSQLYVVNKEKIKENAYYILNGTLVYSYFYKGVGMNSSLIYNQYINQATDSGFVLYKGSSYYGIQTIFLKKLQLQGSYSYNNRPELKYFTLETSGDYALEKSLKIGIGIKYNKTNEGGHYWGERVQMTAEVMKLGRLQLQYEKSYLPSIKQTLYPVEIGRVSWYKYF